MRSILVTMLLLIAVLWIYRETVEGSTGTRQSVHDRGASINGTIERINP
ncbi:hypothetical protein ABE504_14600 [Paenibacillus oryzisoli]